MMRHSVRYLLAGVSVLPMLAIATPVSAQQEASSGVLNEIIVTSRKRGDEVLQDIPATITALSSETLEKMGVTDFTDFAYQIPGLTFFDGGAGEKSYIIRGIRSAGQQQVSVYYDEVPLPGVQDSASNSGSQTTDLKIFDVNRVEVLRGPQGTTFGANAQIGTVRFILNKPNLNDVEATVKVGANYTEHGDPGANVYAMFNMPVSEDKFGLRFVGYYDREGGYVDNVRLGFNDINWLETAGFRLMGQFRPAENVTLDFMAWVQDRRNGGSNRFHPFLPTLNNEFGDFVPEEARFIGGDLKVGDYTFTGKPDQQQIYSTTLNWDFGDAALTATASYYKRDFEFRFDSSWIIFFLGVTEDPINPVRPDLVPAMTDQRQDVEQKAFELRVASTNDNRFQYLAGMFYRDRESNFQSFVPVTDPVSGRTFDPGTPFGTNPDVGAGIPGCHPCVFARKNFKQIEELAFFGEVSYELTDRFEILGGLRWFRADQEDLGQTVFNFALFAADDTLADPTPGQFDEDQLIKKVQLSYKASDDVVLFALASQGFRLGGTNQQSIVAVPLGFEADSLWNYEAGVKSSWADGRYIVNANVFYIDWTNIQVDGDTPDGAFGFVGNAGAAEVTGFELEIQGQPNDNFSFTAGVSYLPKAQLSEDQVSDTIVATGKKGDDLPGIPTVTINATAQYSFDMTDEWGGYFRGEFSHNGGSRTELSPANPNDRPQRGFELLNVRIGAVKMDSDLDIVFYMENIFDARPDIRIATGGAEPTNKITATPRQIGIELTKRF